LSKRLVRRLGCIAWFASVFSALTGSRSNGQPAPEPDTKLYRIRECQAPRLKDRFALNSSRHDVPPAPEPATELYFSRPHHARRHIDTSGKPRSARPDRRPPRHPATCFSCVQADKTRVSGSGPNEASFSRSRETSRYIRTNFPLRRSPGKVRAPSARPTASQMSNRATTVRCAHAQSLRRYSLCIATFSRQRTLAMTSPEGIGSAVKQHVFEG
jgi:hypothetical protein